MTAILANRRSRHVVAAAVLALGLPAAAGAWAGPLPSSPALRGEAAIVEVRHGRKGAAIAAGVAVGALGAAAAAAAANRGYYETDGYAYDGYEAAPVYHHAPPAYGDEYVIADPAPYGYVTAPDVFYEDLDDLPVRPEGNGR